jgi:hypothetical protein
MGMLLCLDRQQRMVFLLGEMLETSDVIGAELLGLGRANFRQLLARARTRLSDFMRGRCGVFDPAAPCRCARKMGAFVRDGIINPENLQFARGQRPRMQGKQLAHAVSAFQRSTLQDLRDLYPYFEAPDVVDRLRKAISSQTAAALFDLETRGAS